MSKNETVILTNMVMVYEGDRILVQDRLNPNWPGITFPGGHVELKESFVQSAIREVKEETGLDISNLDLCGIKQFPAIHESIPYRYIVIFYKTNSFSGTIKSSEEGEIKWISLADIERCQCAPSFKEMLDVFLNDDVSEFIQSYEDGEWISRTY